MARGEGSHFGYQRIAKLLHQADDLSATTKGHCVFNVPETIIENPTCFCPRVDMNVLILGNWLASATRASFDLVLPLDVLHHIIFSFTL